MIIWILLLELLVANPCDARENYWELDFIGACPCFETRFIKIELCLIKLKKKKKKKKRRSIELDFRDIEFQNATIRLKNVTIGLPKLGMG